MVIYTVKTLYNKVLRSRIFCFKCYIRYFVISVVNKQENTTQSISISLELKKTALMYPVL